MLDHAAIAYAPYPGLRSFRRDEYDIFFGRDEHVAEMIGKLRESHFLCVTGPSGSGKSSLARTGLFNGLEAGFLKGRGSDWIFCDLHPQTDPLGRLCDALAAAILFGETRPDMSPDETRERTELTNFLQNHIETTSNDLNPAVSRVVAVEDRPIVILVDQFEEIFRYAQSDPHAVTRFVDVLLKTAAAQREIYVIITIRTDELEKCSRYTGLTGAINQSQFLTPTLDRFQMQEAIEGPIVLFGGRVDPELSVWLLNGLEEQLDKLPLMQHALKLCHSHKTARAGPEGVAITLGDFCEVFGIDRATLAAEAGGRRALQTSLSNRLDAIYRSLSRAQKRRAKLMFCALTTLESRGRDIRRPVSLKELAEIIGASLEETREVVIPFSAGEEAYLRPAGRTDIRAEDIIDVTHECVLRLWTRLQERWLPAEHEAVENVRTLARHARDREEGAKSSAIDRLLGRGLLSGYLLKRYGAWWNTRKPSKAWATRHLETMAWTRGANGDAPLSAVEIHDRIGAFVKASVAHNFAVKVVASAAAVALVAGASYAWTYQQRQQLTIERNKAESDLVIAQQDLLIAEQKADAELRILRERNIAALTGNVAALNPGPHTDNPVDVLSGSAESVAEIANLAAEDETGETDALGAEAFRKLWRSNFYVRELRRFDHGDAGDDQVRAAAFAADGRRIVTFTQGAELLLWDLGDVARPVARLDVPKALTATHPHRGRSVDVAPDGLIAFGTQGGAVAVASVAEDSGGAEAFSVTELYAGPPSTESAVSVMDVEFSEDGALLAAAALTGEVFLWARDAAADGGWALRTRFGAGEIRQRAGFAGSAAVWAVDIDPAGQTLAAAFGDGAVCLIALDGPGATCSGQGHPGGDVVKTVRFHPARGVLVSAGNDDRAVVWSASHSGDGAPRLSLQSITLWHESDIWDASFSPDGRYLATAAWDGAVSIFDVANWRPVRTLRGHLQTLRTVQFDPSSLLLVTSSLDHTARVWSPFTPRAIDLDRSFATERLGRGAGPRSVDLVAPAHDGSWVAFSNTEAIWLKDATPVPTRLALPGDDSIAGLSAPRVDRLAAPAAQEMLLASLSGPEVLVWRPGADGLDRAAIRLPGEDFRETKAERLVAVDPAGEIVATTAFDGENFHALVCRIPDAVGPQDCGPESRNLVASVELPYELPPHHDHNEDCRRPSHPTALALSSDGTRLAVGRYDCVIRVHDLAAGGEPVMLYGHVGRIRALDFSKDGASVVSASEDWTARIWRIETGEEIRLQDHRSRVTDAKYSPSGDRIATVSHDEALFVWDAATGEEVARLPGHESSILAVGFAGGPGGPFMVTGASDGTLNVIPHFETTEALVAYSRRVLASIGAPLELK